jgi:hypothetical protein
VERFVLRQNIALFERHLKSDIADRELRQTIEIELQRARLALESPVTIDDSCTFDYPAPAAAFDYWLSVRGKRIMPSLNDIVPKRMQAFIAHVSLIDILVADDDTTSYQVRVAGSEVEAVLGPRTGKPLLDGVPKELEQRWLEPLEQVRRSAKPLRGSGRVTFGHKTDLVGEYLHAPLGDGAVPTAIFCAFAASPAQG